MSTDYDNYGSSNIITSSDTEDVITIGTTDTLGTILNTTMNYSINNCGTMGTSGTAGTGLYSTYQYTTNGTAPWITVNPNTSNTLDVKGDANFQGDIKFKGRSLEELFAKIEDRLAILQPDPAKLEKYEALRKAYDHYKLLEKLIHED